MPWTYELGANIDSFDSTARFRGENIYETRPLGVPEKKIEIGVEIEIKIELDFDFQIGV